MASAPTASIAANAKKIRHPTEPTKGLAGAWASCRPFTGIRRAALRDRVPILAFGQDEGMTWTRRHDDGFDVMGLDHLNRHNLIVTTLELLRPTDKPRRSWWLASEPTAAT